MDTILILYFDSGLLIDIGKFVESILLKSSCNIDLIFIYIIRLHKLWIVMTNMFILISLSMFHTFDFLYLIECLLDIAVDEGAKDTNF